MLKVPSTVKHFVEHGGRSLYGRGAAVTP